MDKRYNYILWPMWTRARARGRAVFIFAFHADCALLDCISCIPVLSLYGTPSLVLALSRALGLALFFASHSKGLSRSRIGHTGGDSK